MKTQEINILISANPKVGKCFHSSACAHTHVHTIITNTTTTILIIINNNKIAGINNHWTIISPNINRLDSPIKKTQSNTMDGKTGSTLRCLLEIHLSIKGRCYLRIVPFDFTLIKGKIQQGGISNLYQNTFVKETLPKLKSPLEPHTSIVEGFNTLFSLVDRTFR